MYTKVSKRPDAPRPSTRSPRRRRNPTANEIKIGTAALEGRRAFIVHRARYANEVVSRMKNEEQIRKERREMADNDHNAQFV